MNPIQLRENSRRVGVPLLCEPVEGCGFVVEVVQVVVTLQALETGELLVE